MVTANSLGQDLNIRMDSLNDSVFEADRELVRVALKAITDVVARIKPLIHYIGVRTDDDKHVIMLTKVDNSSTVAVAENGEFGYYSGEKFIHDPSSWMRVSFQALLDSLKEALVDAEAKRAQHLKAIEIRRQMLEEISKIASSTASAQ